MNVTFSPKVLCGHAHESNRCVAASDTGYLAFASHTVINVIQNSRPQLLQTLHGHTDNIVSLAWCPESYAKTLRAPHRLLLASGCSKGALFVWDVAKGSYISRLTTSDSQQTVKKIEWILTKGFQLLVLYQPNVIVLWDALTGSKLWAQLTADLGVDMAVSRGIAPALCIAGSSFLMFYKDFDAARPREPQSLFLQNGADRSKLSLSPNQHTTTLTDLKQFVFHPVHEHVALLVFSKEVLVVELAERCLLTSFSAERVLFSQLSISGRFLYTLFDNGNISVKEEVGPLEWSPRAHEYLRLTRQTRPLGFTPLPLSCARDGETGAVAAAAVVLSDGRVLYYDLMKGSSQSSYLQHATGGGDCYQLTLSALWSGLASPITCLALCPSVAAETWNTYRPLAAVGSNQGLLQIVNLSSGEVEKDFSMSSFTVQGIAWCGDSSLLAHWYTAHDSASPRGGWNEVMHVDVNSGQLTHLRPTKQDTDETPIKSIAVSPAGDYCSVIFESGTAEIWDITTRQKLRDIRNQKLVVHQWALQRKSKSEEATNNRETLMVSNSNGSVRNLTIGPNREVKAGSPLHSDLTLQCTAIAWKLPYVVLSDFNKLAVWHLKDKEFKVMGQSNQPIVKMLFSPGKTNFNLLVLYADAVEVWDISSAELVRRRHFPPPAATPRHIAWWASDIPVVAFSNSLIHIMNFSLESSNSDVVNRNFHCFFSPELCLPRSGLILKWQLQEADGMEPVKLGSGNHSLQEEVNSQLTLIPLSTRSRLAAAYSPTSRYLTVAELFGDTFEMCFWRLARRYIAPGDVEADDSFTDGLFALQKTYHASLLALTKRECTAGSEEALQRLSMLGDSDAAVTHLLDASSPDYTSALKAALLSLLPASDATAQSTVKLVASTLLARGETRRGVELLAGIQQQAEGCRHLQAAGLWLEALRVGRATLSEAALTALVKRHVDHTLASNGVDTAVFLLMMVGAWEHLLSLLLASRYAALAARLLQACRASGLLSEDTQVTDKVWAAAAQYTMELERVDASRELAAHIADPVLRENISKEIDILFVDSTPVADVLDDLVT